MTKFQTIFLFVLFISTLLVTFSTARDALTTGHPLVDGETLVSAAGNFALGFFSPPGSKNRYVGIWYNKVSAQTVAWVASRETPVPNTNGTLSITRNGSLLITANNSTIVLWSSAMAGMIKPVAQLLDNGNFVVREAGSSDDTQGFAWQSFDHPADTLLPGMKLGWNLKKGLNRKLTAWTSASDPSPGAYSSSIDISGDPQLVLSQGSNWVWRAGPWDGVQFSGIPQMKTFLVFNYTFVDNQEEIYYQYNLTSDSTITRLAVDSAGTLERTVWLEKTGEWNAYWHWPNDECDSVSACGAFGVCNAENSPLCSCLPGFRPKSPEEWALRKTSRGCMRRTALDCRNGTDGFAKLTGMKLPDTSSATVDRSVGLDECMTRCLRNCSCTAYANEDIRNGGSGCIIWTRELTDLRLYMDRGQDLYVRLASKDLDIIDSKSNQSYNRGRKQCLLIMGIVLAILLALCLGFFVWRTKKKKIVSSTRDSGVTIGNKDVETLGGSDVELPIFDFSRIVAATNNFSIRNKLGEGGFGPVYKGTLGEEEDIAVKRLSQNSVQGLDEFKNEVILISKLQHRNLVRLRGCCIECGERILIYEYMDNKSLDVFLFDEEKSKSLDWQARRHIIIGIARGLLYLHQDSRLTIIHRDLKASNILLDKEMNPKISDFGIARIFGGDEIQANTEKVIGTLGYMSPEYVMDGTFSLKSDVYSFGVLLLEIISSKKNREVVQPQPRLSLLKHAWSLWNDGKALDLVDKSISCSFSIPEVLRYIKVGLLCVQEDPEDRPTMSSIILMLASDDVLLPSPKYPGYIAATYVNRMNDSFIRHLSHTINNVTISILNGR